MNKLLAAEFEYTLRNHWLIEARDADSLALFTYLRNPKAAINEQEFKLILADAILNARYTPKEYERLTSADVDTPEDVERDLRELWTLLWGAEPVSMPSN